MPWSLENNSVQEACTTHVPDVQICRTCRTSKVHNENKIIFSFYGCFWMDMIESRILYELDPSLPRLFVLPISSVLGKLPLVRAGHTGTIPYSMRGEAKEKKY